MSLKLINLLQSKFIGKIFLQPNWTTRILDINRLMIERSMSAHAYVAYSPDSYEDLRKKRLRKLIDDTEWARHLSVKETQREKRNKFRLLDELILAVCRDTFGTLLLKTIINYSDLDQFLGKPLDNAKEYYNSQLSKLLHENESPMMSINDKWVLVKL